MSVVPASEERQPRIEEAMARIVAEIDAERIEVYRNILKQPYITFRVPGQLHGTHHLHDEIVRAFFANFVWEKCGVVPHGQEITRLLGVLAGRAIKTHRVGLDDPAILKLLQSEPVLAVAYEFMWSHTSDDYERRAEPLWREWWQFAKGRGLLQPANKHFPAGGGSLAKLLRHYQHVLAALGIDVTFKRSNGSLITLRRRLDVSGSEPSREPSGLKCPDAEEITPQDDKAQRIARLKHNKVNGANQKGTVYE